MKNLKSCNDDELTSLLLPNTTPCLQYNIPATVLGYSLDAVGFKYWQWKETFLSSQMSRQGQSLSTFM